MDHTYSVTSGVLEANGESPSMFNNFNETIIEFLREHSVPGAALAISLHGKLVYQQGFGRAGCGQLVTSSSVFRIASISKILTAIGIMRLEEEGKLSLDDKIFRMKPPGVLSYMRSEDSSYSYSKVTIKHLLQHTVGWDRDSVGDHVYWYQDPQHRQHLNPWDNEQLVKYVLTHILRHRPGSRYAYSNLGYMVLGLVIEKVTGQKYEEYIKSILTQVKVYRLQVGRTKKCQKAPNEVEYYCRGQSLEQSVFNDEGLVTPQYGGYPMETTGAYGGWVACASDLVHIIDSLILEETNYPLDRETVQRMVSRPKYEKKSSQTWYGLGLDVEDSGETFGHTGMMDGTSTTLFHDKSGLSWALLLNAWPPGVDLNGLMRFALSSVRNLPLWHGSIQTLLETQGRSTIDEARSADSVQCVQILVHHSDLNNRVENKMLEKYLISHISAMSMDNNVWFNIVYERSQSDRGQYLCMDVTAAQSNAFLQSQAEKGIVIHLMDSYIYQGEIMYVFVMDSGLNVSQALHCRDCIADHLETVQINRNAGFVLKSQSVLHFKSRLFISALYEQNINLKNQHVWVGVTMDNFTTELRKVILQKFRPIDLKFYSDQQGPKVGGVWIQELKRTNCFQIYNVDRYGFLYELQHTMSENFPVKYISSYKEDEGINFAIIWDHRPRKK